MHTGYPSRPTIALRYSRPNVAFVSKASISQQPLPEKYDRAHAGLAVEVVSPSNSIQQIRRKAAIYLDNGTSLVWIVLPADKGVDVCRSVRWIAS